MLINKSFAFNLLSQTTRLADLLIVSSDVFYFVLSFGRCREEIAVWRNEQSQMVTNDNQKPNKVCSFDCLRGFNVVSKKATGDFVE